MATTRVYLLARELGVSSTAIMKKCQNEGLDIKNHMAVISAGLAATIREWFSEGEHKTTVETADKVDLEKVRIKKTRKKAVAEPPPAAEEAPAVPAEPVTEQPPLQEAAPIVIEPPAKKGYAYTYNNGL